MHQTHVKKRAKAPKLMGISFPELKLGEIEIDKSSDIQINSPDFKIGD